MKWVRASCNGTTMRVITSIPEMQGLMLAIRRQPGRRIGLVPTMGCLHAGHLSLVRDVAQRGCIPVVSVFVNPLQFGPAEDFSRYPRPFDDDCRLCEREGVDYLFAPPPDAMYPPGHSVFVEETQLSRGLCGASRPGHFRGVTTVVAKLFQIVQPDVAAFGRKDAQQARIIQHMAACLSIPVDVLVCPIVREPDGLAMSSRNRYLSPEERRQALCLVEALRRLGALYQAGDRRSAEWIRIMTECVRSCSMATVDYAAVVDYENLEPVETAGPGTLAALAVRIGKTRLIDNLLITADGEPAL
jgi:pantoate--beta-alanine ligase